MPVDGTPHAPLEWEGTPSNGQRRVETETLTLTLHKGKETKNKLVYGTADGSVIQRVYIDREALGKEPPERVQVVISAE